MICSKSSQKIIARTLPDTKIVLTFWADPKGDEEKQRNKAGTNDSWLTSGHDGPWRAEM